MRSVLCAVRPPAGLAVFLHCFMVKDIKRGVFLNILVVGCGRAGANIVRILEQMGHEVAVLDSSPSELQRLESVDGYQFSGVATIGIPIDIDALRQAGIETCDAAAIATPDDSVNIMVAQIAKTIFHVPRVIARVTDPTLKDFFTKEYGLRTVCTTNLTVESMLLGLLDDQESRTITIGATTSSFVTVPVSLRDVGRSLNRVRAPEGELLYGVLRANGIVELAVQPMPVLEEGDQIIYSRIAD